MRQCLRLLAFSEELLTKPPHADTRTAARPNCHGHSLRCEEAPRTAEMLACSDRSVMYAGEALWQHGWLSCLQHKVDGLDEIESSEMSPQVSDKKTEGLGSR